MTEFLESGLSMDAYGHWHGDRLCMDEQRIPTKSPPSYCSEGLLFFTTILIAG